MAIRKRTGNRYQVPMIVKAFELLEGFREKTEGLTYKELIERYPKISKVSIYRILCSLEAVGYLRKDPDTSRFELSAKCIELGRVTERRQNIIRLARPYMEQILKRFGENVNLAKIEGRELVYLATLEGLHPLRVTEMPTRKQSLYCSSVGKAILAFLPEDERNEIVENTEYVKLTPNTISSRRALRQELKRIRERGYAIDNEENLLGVRCVGSVIRNAKGYPVAGMSVTGPVSRLADETIQEIGASLCSATLALASEQFGFSPESRVVAQ